MNTRLGFGSFSVGKKLSTGFIFLTILAAGMAAIGIQTLNKLNQDAQSVSLATAAESSLLRARAEEKNFRIRKDEEFADAAITHADKAAALVRQLKPVLSTENDLQLADEILAGVDQYKILMEDFRPRVNDRPMVVDAIENRLRAEAQIVVNNALSLQQSQTARLQSEYKQGITKLIATITVIIFIALIVSWRLTRSITQPIAMAIQVSERIAAGDLTAEIKTERQDEFGKLLTTFGAMTRQLRELVRRIDTTSAEIEQSSQTLSNISNQTVTELQHQNDETQQVASAMTQMVSTVEEVASSAESANNAAQGAHTKSGLGNQAVSQTLDHVKELNDKLRDTSTELEALETDTRNIVSVLDVIKAVAEQTNLLALNAAIEAARAGEQGRGFSVVADEVRSLAQRTQNSATEIENIINKLVSSVETTVSTMGIAAELGGKTLQQARTTGETIESMVKAIEDIRQFNDLIATATDQQTSVADEVNRNIVRIRDIGENSSDSAKQTSAASDNLNVLANQLKSQVSTFQL